MPFRIAIVFFVAAVAIAVGNADAQQPARPIVAYENVVSPENFGLLEAAVWGVAAVANPEETLGDAVIMYAYDSEATCSNLEQRATMDGAAEAGMAVSFAAVPRTAIGYAAELGMIASFAAVPRTAVSFAAVPRTVMDGAAEPDVVGSSSNVPATSAEGQTWATQAGVMFHGPVESACNLIDVHRDRAAGLAAHYVELVGNGYAMAEDGNTMTEADDLEALVRDIEALGVEIELVDYETIARMEEVVSEIGLTTDDGTPASAILSVGRLDWGNRGNEIWAFCGEPAMGRYCFGHPEAVQ